MVSLCSPPPPAAELPKARSAARHKCLGGWAAGVSQLYPGFGALSADRAGQPRKPGQEAVIEDAEFAPAVAPAAFGRGHLHRDKTDATARRAECRRSLRGDGSPRVGAALRGHARHHDAVGRLDRPDPDAKPAACPLGASVRSSMAAGYVIGRTGYVGGRIGGKNATTPGDLVRGIGAAPARNGLARLLRQGRPAGRTAVRGRSRIGVSAMMPGLNGVDAHADSATSGASDCVMPITANLRQRRRQISGCRGDRARRPD